MVDRRLGGTVALAVIAALALSAEAVLAAGRGGTFAFVSLHDYTRPLLLGVAAAGLLLLIRFNSRAWRLTAMGLLALLGLGAAICFGRYATPIITDADIAVGEVYVELATRGNLLVGAYSRFGWHHPGPLPFYLTAPLYAASGHQAATVYSAATLINLSALVGIFWIIAAESRGATAAIVTAGCMAVVWRLNWFLASPWNAHIGVLPAILFVVSAAAIASGAIRWWPVLVFAGSLAAQAHVGVVPLVVLVSGIALVTALARRADRPRVRHALNGALWLVALLWALPLADVLANQGGNALALWRFFVTEAAAPHTIGETLGTGAYALLSLFRPEFDLPWGAHFEVHGLAWLAPAAAAEVAGLALLAVWHSRRGHRFDAWLAGMALAATAVCVWSLGRVRGDILSHELLRLAAIGSLNLGVLCAGLVHSVAARTAPGLMSTLATRSAGALVVAAAVTLAVRDLNALTAFEVRRERGRVRGVEAADAIAGFLARGGLTRPLLVVGPDRYAEAAAVLLRLTQRGTRAAVDDGYVGMFSEAFRRTGDEDVTLVFADLDQHRILREQPGTTLLFQAMPLFVHVVPTAAR